MIIRCRLHPLYYYKDAISEEWLDCKVIGTLMRSRWNSETQSLRPHHPTYCDNIILYFYVTVPTKAVRELIYQLHNHRNALSLTHTHCPVYWVITVQWLIDEDGRSHGESLSHTHTHTSIHHSAHSLSIHPSVGRSTPQLSMLTVSAYWAVAWAICYCAATPRCIIREADSERQIQRDRLMEAHADSKRQTQSIAFLREVEFSWAVVMIQV